MLELKEPSSSRIINSKATWASKNLSYKLIYLFTFAALGLPCCVLCAGFV